MPLPSHPPERPRRFSDTTPLPPPKVRAQKVRPQRAARPPRHQPNSVPRVARVYLALIVAVWVIWGGLGLLSGTIVVVIGPPIVFWGASMPVLAVAIFLGAAACALHIVDHYDRRPNEAAYKQARRVLWVSAGVMLALAVLVLFIQDHVPALRRMEDLGVASREQLLALGRSRILFEALQPWREAATWLLGIGIGWSLLVGLVLRLTDERSTQTAGQSPLLQVVLFMTCGLPIAAGASVLLLIYVASGEPARDSLAGDWGHRAWMGFIYTGTLVAMAATAVCAHLSVLALRRFFGLDLSRKPLLFGQSGRN